MDCIDFIPTGIKLYTKQRTARDRQGGGIAIGHLKVDRIILEEIETKGRDILILEGTIYNERIRIILTYMDCCKEANGPRFRANREIQEEIEKYIQVEANTNLICLHSPP